MPSGSTLARLALSFLLLVGFSLVAEAFHQEIPKGYLYFAMAFSVFVELINQRVRRQAPVRLKKATLPSEAPTQTDPSRGRLCLAGGRLGKPAAWSARLRAAGDLLAPSDSPR